MSSSDDRNKRIGQILDDVAARITRGENVDFAEIPKRHSDLLPELGEQIQALQAILVAEQMAQDNGETPKPAVADRDLIDLLNQALPTYRVLERIDAGGQGIVLKAVQLSTQRQVAIKVLQDGPLISERRRQRFVREVKITSRLQLPNIVQVYDSGVVHGRFYFVMQYILGVTIDDYVFVHGLSARRRIELFLEMLRAVSRAHQHAVIHRDLKPSNIMVDVTGEPQILDFGLAKALDDDADDERPVSVMGNAVGTLQYVSPEQATGIEEVDVRSDIYSLGVVLFELLTRELPVDTSGPSHEALRRILHTPARRLRDVLVDGGWTGLPQRHEIDDDIEAIVAKALAKNREDRYQSAEAFARDLQSYLDGSIVVARADQRSYLLRKTLRQYRTHILVSAAFVVLVTAAAIVSTGFWFQVRAQRDNARQVATLAHATLDNVVTEIDDAIRPLAGGMAARTRLLDSVDENLRALETLVATDVSMQDVLHSIHEKRGDIAYARGERDAAQAQLSALIDGLLSGRQPEQLDDAELLTLCRTYRKLSRTSDHAEKSLQESIRLAEALVARAPNNASHHLELCTALNELAGFEHQAGRYLASAAAADHALNLILNKRSSLAITPDDISWNEIHADTLQRCANARIMLHQGSLARSAFEQAVEILRQLSRAQPENVQYRHQLVEGLTNLGFILEQQADLDKAAEIMTEAIQRAQYLVQVEPDNHTWLHTLAKAELRMSIVQRFRGDLELGRQHADEAVRIGEKLVAVLPADPQVNLSLALALSARANILRDEGYRENPLADLRRSAEITKLFLGTIEDSVPHLTELAENHMGMASCLGRLYRYDEAWTELQEALQIYLELCASEPDSSERQSRLASCLINLAAWHIRMRSTENDASAVELLDEAEAILRDLCDSGRTEGRDMKFVEKLDAIERNRQIIAGRHDPASK